MTAIDPSQHPHVPRARNPGEIDVFELAMRRSGGEALNVVDVREPHEIQISRIEGVTVIPLSQFEGRWPAELGHLREQELILMCRSGGRSARVQAYLQHCGFRSVRNLVGGILAWSEAIDPSQPRY
jgi:adenylyltransferase/sulfurtransferase